MSVITGDDDDGTGEAVNMADTFRFEVALGYMRSGLSGHATRMEVHADYPPEG